MTTTSTIQPSELAYRELEADIYRLLRNLKPTIADDYRASDDPDDKLPGMQVTIGATVQDDGTFQWDYQTGDNSFSGGAYRHATWGIGYLYRRSNCRELAASIVSEIADDLSY